MFRVLILLGFGFLLPFQMRSQPSPSSGAEQALMCRATFIFEGTVVRTAGQFNTDSTRQYLTSVIRLTRSVKGPLRTGTVRVVYKGAAVDKRSIRRDPKTREVSFAMLSAPSHGPDTTQGTVLGGVFGGQRPVVFFCRVLAHPFTPNVPRLPTDNPQTLEILGLGLVDLDYSVISDVGGRFSDLPTFYRYLAEQYQVGMK